MRPLLFVGGVSGVGKTTLLDQLPGRDKDWIRLSAGRLIADELGATSLPTDDEREVLRYQEALVRAYQRQAIASHLPAVMDGHFTVSMPDGPRILPGSVFKQLSPSILVLLCSRADRVQRQRLERDEQAPSLLEIEASMHAEREAATAIAQQLGLPLHELAADQSSLPPLSDLVKGLTP